MTRLAVALYRRALVVLPPEFRRRYEEEMVEDFRRGLERSAPLLALAAGLWDVGRVALAQRMRARRTNRGREGTVAIWLSELRMATRALARRPGFTAVVVLTLALGVAANVAVFTVVNAVLLRPLPFPESDRIVTIDHHAPGLGFPEMENSPGTIWFYEHSAHSLDGVAMVSQSQRNLTGLDAPARVPTAIVTAPFFRVMKVAPALGRAFDDRDGQKDAEPVAILTHGVWIERFGGDSGVLGRVVQLDGVATRIVGVMPEGFAYPAPNTAFLLPTAVSEDSPFGEFGRRVVARLAPGVSLADAQREIEGLQERMFTEVAKGDVFAPSFRERAGWSVSVVLLQDRIVGDIRQTLWILLAAVGLVLVVAWANVANLFLARSDGRQREVAVRAAMGASRARLAFSFVSEAVVPGLLSGTVGVALAAAAVRQLVRTGPPLLPRLTEIRLDAAGALFGLGIALVAAVAFGLLPVARHLGQAYARVLRDGGRGATDGRQRHRVRTALVVAQLAMALVLLVSSSLLVRSYRRLLHVDPGFDPAGVTVVSISTSGLAEADQGPFAERAAEALRAVPGVTGVGATNGVPLGDESFTAGSFTLSSRPKDGEQMPPTATRIAVTPGFFEALRVPLTAGEPLTAAALTGPRLAWVNETFARTVLPQGAIGERFTISDEDTEEWTIAGVVGDVRQQELTEDVKATIYLPSRPEAASATNLDGLSLVVRSDRPTADVTAEARRIVRELDPDVPLTTIRSMDEIVDASMARQSFTMTLIGLAGVLAFILGAIGVYGVNSYIVGQRTREIGVRMALGARPERVQTMVIRQGLRAAIAGIAIGLGIALATTRLLGAILYQISARDPISFVVVPVLLLGISAAACWLPARRASRIDPVRALGAE